MSTHYDSIDALSQALLDASYLPDRGLATALYLSLSLEKPLLLEGEAGVGKTEAAKALARAQGARLIQRRTSVGGSADPLTSHSPLVTAAAALNG